MKDFRALRAQLVAVLGMLTLVIGVAGVVFARGFVADGCATSHPVRAQGIGAAAAVVLRDQWMAGYLRNP